MTLNERLLAHGIGYCESTTIHGFAYLPHDITGRVAKLFWAGVIIIGMSLALTIVTEVSYCNGAICGWHIG